MDELDEPEVGSAVVCLAWSSKARKATLATPAKLELSRTMAMWFPWPKAIRMSAQRPSGKFVGVTGRRQGALDSCDKSRGWSVDRSQACLLIDQDAVAHQHLWHSVLASGVYVSGTGAEEDTGGFFKGIEGGG